MCMSVLPTSLGHFVHVMPKESRRIGFPGTGVGRLLSSHDSTANQIWVPEEQLPLTAE